MHLDSKAYGQWLWIPGSSTSTPRNDDTWIMRDSKTPYSRRVMSMDSGQRRWHQRGSGGILPGAIKGEARRTHDCEGIPAPFLYVVEWCDP